MKGVLFRSNRVFFKQVTGSPMRSPAISVWVAKITGQISAWSMATQMRPTAPCSGLMPLRWQQQVILMWPTPLNLGDNLLLEMT